jgi:hypothetical protein
LIKKAIRITHQHQQQKLIRYVIVLSSYVIGLYGTSEKLMSDDVKRQNDSSRRRRRIIRTKERRKQRTKLQLQYGLNKILCLMSHPLNKLRDPVDPGEHRLPLLHIPYMQTRIGMESCTRKSDSYGAKQGGQPSRIA